MIRWVITILSLICLPCTAQNLSRNLDFYLNEGVKNSPLLNDYRNQISSAMADSLLARASNMPLVEAKSQLQYSPVYDNFGYDEVITDGGNYMAMMGVSQTIFNKKTRDNRYQSIYLQKQSLDNSSVLSTYEISRFITDQYLVAFSVLKDLELNNTFLKLSRDENEIIGHFVQNGICKQTDYLSLLIETQSQEIIVSQLQGQYRKELTSLNRLCGLNDTSWYDLEEPHLEMKGIPDIAGSPQLIQYRIDSVKIENDKAAVDLRYKPKVNWFADAGFLTSNPWNFYRHFGYSAGLSLNFPVYDGKQRNIEKQKLGLTENSRSMYEQNYRKQYSQQILQLSVELRTLTETSDRIGRQLATSELLVKALKEQLEKGLVIMTDYITAVKNFKNINRNLILVDLQKLHVINEINFLMTQ